MLMLYLFCGVSVLMPIFFIIRRQYVDDNQTLLLKCLSTFLIVFLSAINYYVYRGEASYFAITITALLLCLTGDFMLGYCHVLGKNHRLYNKLRGLGMLVFMLVHIIFTVNYGVHLETFKWYLIFIPIITATIMFLCSPLAGIKWPHVSLAIISLLYMFTICFMLFFGTYYAYQLIKFGGDRAIIRASLVIIGSILFFASDTILCFMYFGGKKGAVISVINLTTYYLSLICLALAF